jgi:hypothetical protein
MHQVEVASISHSFDVGDIESRVFLTRREHSDACSRVISARRNPVAHFAVS